MTDLKTDGILNAAGREVPAKCNGRKVIPYQGVGMVRPEGRQASPRIATCANFPADGNKVVSPGGDLVAGLEKALHVAGLKDGMSISTHHHFRNGDLLGLAVFEAARRLGVKKLRWYPSASFPCHAPLLDRLQDGTIHHIEGSMNGPLGEKVGGKTDFNLCALKIQNINT